MIFSRIFLRKHAAFALLVGWSLTGAFSGCGSQGGTDDTPEDTSGKTVLKAPNPIPDIGPIPDKTQLDCPKGSHLTYSNFGQGFLRNYCQTCHSSSLPEKLRGGAPFGVDFDTAADAALWRGEMLAAAGVGTKMPPAQNVTTLDKQQFSEWLKCGAPSGG